MIYRIARAERRLERAIQQLPEARFLRRPIRRADWNSLWRELIDGKNDLGVSLALVRLLQREQAPFRPSELEANALRAGRAKPFVHRRDLIAADTLARLSSAVEVGLRGEVTRQRLRWCYRDAVLPGADRLEHQPDVEDPGLT